jgi:general secretion pathway protein J
MTPGRYRHRGFTLIEMLVALAVFAIMSALAYGTLNQTFDSAEILSARMDRLQAIQRTVRLVGQDFMQLAPRPVRNELGDGYGAALNTSFNTGFALELTRGGWSNPMALPRGTLQRAAYRLEEDELIRYHWNVLDRTLSNQVIGVTLIDDVESVAFRFMQGDGEWTEQWPPDQRAGPGGLRLRPRAVQFVLTLVDEGEITRIMEVAP